MNIVKEHKAACKSVLDRAESHIEKMALGPTYFCRKAGVQIHALNVLRKGTATPETLQKLSDYLDQIEGIDQVTQEGVDAA